MIAQEPKPLEETLEYLDGKTRIVLSGCGGFGSLSYFPPDPAYRFVVQLHECQARQVLDVPDSTNETRRLWRWGAFRFEIGSVPYTLHAYKADAGEDRLFVPFRDKTSGGETYGAGRSLDLEPERHLTADGTWILDFNEAYNPWGASSDAYACPLVPPENWLPVPVRAGEKEYRATHREIDHGDRSVRRSRDSEP